MANTLLDTIRQNQPKMQPQQATSGAQVSNILQTKATGRVSSDSGAAASNIGEQQAQQTAQTAQRAAEQQGNAAAATLGIQESNQAQSQELAEKQLDEQVEDARSRLLQQTNALLQDYSQGTRTLDAQRDKSRLEQIGFGLRLTNEGYLSNLQREGQKSRLTNNAQFQEELTRSIFADEQELLSSDLSFRALMKADDREFQRQMAELSIEDALKLAAAEASAANNAAAWGAAGELAGAGIDAWATASKEKE